MKKIIINTDIDITTDEECTILEYIGDILSQNKNRKHVHVYSEEYDDSIPSEILGGGCFTQPIDNKIHH